MITIRKATIDDVQTLQDLNDLAFVDNSKYDKDINPEWAQSDSGKKYFSEVTQNPESCCLIAEDSGKPIGYIIAESKPMDYQKSKYLEIDNLGVIPEYQSRGVGSQLMEDCLKWGKSHGYQKAMVNTYLSNTRALEFYKEKGFAEIDVNLVKKI